MNRRLVWGAVLALGCMTAGAAPLDTTVSSPDRRIALRLEQTDSGELRYSIQRNGEWLIAPSRLRVQLAEGDLSALGDITVSTRTIDEVRRLVATKSSMARNLYNEVTLTAAPKSGAAGSLRWIFRVYNDGVAFRYLVPPNAGLTTLRVRGEDTEFAFGGDYDCHGFPVGRFDSSHEGEFDPIKATRIRAHHLFDLPLVCRTGSNALALTEANLVDYGGLYLRGRDDGGNGVRTRVSPRLDDRSLIASVDVGKAGAGSPWRVIMLGDRLGTLIESNLIANLNPAPDFDTSWIKPGKTAWDWWSGPWLPPPDKGGMDMATIKRYIDFAAESGFEYMMIDEGWCLNSGISGSAPENADVTKTRDGIDMPELVAYAAKKNVGLWLWVQWALLDRQMDAALAQYQAWGIKGIKVDFMDRNDQQMVDYYHKLLRKTATHKLLVDLHGAYPPTGLNRTYPHYLTQEGVLGAEYNKWSRRITATHNVSLAYTRMLIGPIDYTPGGFRNRTPAEFQVVFSPPQVQTTRGHGLGMFVVYESPFQMVSDSPDAYVNADGFDFVKVVPTVWDETRFLAGEIDEYVAVARRKGRDWYIGVLGNEQARVVQLPLNFLGKGSFRAQIYEDGATPTTLNQSTRQVGAKDTLTLKLAPSGGAAVRLAR